MKRKRLGRVCLYGIIIILIGTSYGIFVSITGIGIPCVFYLVTGLKCPGCGITHMCMALMRLDMQAAFKSHPILLSELPFLLGILLRNIYGYIKDGVVRMNRTENIIIWICVILLMGFTVIRNVMGI